MATSKGKAPPSGPYEWDVWLSSRRGEDGKQDPLSAAMYKALTSLSLRVFWPPISLPERTRENNHDWEQKYLTAASNVAVAVVLVSRASFTGRFYDVTKYVWSSKPDDLLVEWDLIIELFDRGRIKVVIPCLVGDLMNAKQVKTQGRILAKLGIDSLDEKAIVARVRDLFKFADKDRSGSIDRRELHDCFEKFGLQVSKAELDELMENADEDGDDSIDIFEFEDMIVQLLETKAGVSVRPAGKPLAKGPGSPLGGSPVGGTKGADAKTAVDEKRLVDEHAVRRPTAEDDEDGRQFYTNFTQSGCLPMLKRTIVSQEMKILTRWLHKLGYGAAEVLWREPHMKGVPSVDSAAGGRPIDQTVKVLFGFNSHIVEGGIHLVVPHAVREIEKRWRESAKLSEEEIRGVRGKPQQICKSSRRPARHRDPITGVPFLDMLAFHAIRQHYYFDVKKCNENIIMENQGTRITYAAQGGHSVILAPPIGAKGTSYVEFHLQNIGRYPYIFVGVNDGTHDVHGEWGASTDPHAHLYFCLNGSKLHDGDYAPFGEARPRVDDRVGILVDMDRSRMEIYVNDVSQGVLTSDIPRPAYFVVDLSWPGQRLEILPRTHWQMLAHNLYRFFEGLPPDDMEQKMEDLFYEYDADKQGTIDAEEFRSALAGLHVHLTDAELEELITDVDTNGSGDIDMDEFKEMIRKVITEHGEGKPLRTIL